MKISPNKKNTKKKDRGLEALRKIKSCERSSNVYIDLLDGTMLYSIYRDDLEEESCLTFTIKSNMESGIFETNACSNIIGRQFITHKSTIFYRAMRKGHIIIGQTNSDEFACGSKTKNDRFGQTLLEGKYIGGSSGGACVSAKLHVDVSIGTDTGGSCRHPAVFCQIIGFKSTFGRIPRSGIVDYSSSMDTVGILSKDIQKIQTIFHDIEGKDNIDCCMLEKTCKTNIAASCILVLCYDSFSEQQKQFIKSLKQKGYEIIFLATKINLKCICSVYEIISSVEMFSNLNKFDAFRFTSLDENKFNTILEPYQKRYSRMTKNTVKKILQGATILRYRNEKYKEALQKRSDIRKLIFSIFKKHQDSIMICPHFSNKEGQEEGYLQIANLSGVPSAVMPIGEKSNEKYEYICVLSKMLGDELIFQFVENNSSI